MKFTLKLGHTTQLVCLLVMIISLTVTSCSASYSLPPESSQINQNSPETDLDESEQWRLMTEEEKAQAWKYILNSPLGIAALNQLAIEGFISPNCPKTFYLNEQYGGFQTMLQVECPTGRGVSIALAYDEMRVIFNRFEDNIENFQVERIRPSN